MVYQEESACNNPFLAAMWGAVGGSARRLERLAVVGQGSLPSVFSVSELAVASIAVSGLAAAELIALSDSSDPSVVVDRRLAAYWFGCSLRPQGWVLPEAWDSVAGAYVTNDGWIRLHTNAPHHRKVALTVLGLADTERKPAHRDEVAAAVAGWTKQTLESAIVARGGCAAAMRSSLEWAQHPQGMAVMTEPLVLQTSFVASEKPDWALPSKRPLHGIRVLDLTRVLAGPVATRMLAGLGAQVLRIDPLDWDEPAVLPDVTLGKRCARLDLRSPEGLRSIEHLLKEADVLVHGYRPGALDGLGLSAERRRQLQPGLVEVSLDAYGWTGPWRDRRGFDSLVQMSSGIAQAGMETLAKDGPFPLPVQALDHSAGYLMAASALMGIVKRVQTGSGSRARVSLARMASLLTSGGVRSDVNGSLSALTPGDYCQPPELTEWGAGLRLQAPVVIGPTQLHWDYPAGPLGRADACWLPNEFAAPNP